MSITSQPFTQFRDVVQSFGKIRYLVSIQDRGEGGGPGVILGKLKYKIAFLYTTS